MKLLEPTQIGEYHLKNRMVMAAMTRSRATEDGVLRDITTTYYVQRANAGLILTEATNISKDAIGSPFTPGLYTDRHIEAWKKVTHAVHENGGLIFAQLWHTGRVGHSIDRSNKLPMAPSAIAIEGAQHFTSEGMKDYETPRAMNPEDIKQTILDYRQAALNAMAAGFDGVELHAANGYLPQQFLSDSANQRTDDYGGSIENKSRFILDVMHELVDAVGGEKVGIKLSPLGTTNDIRFDDPIATYTYLIGELNKMDLAFVEIARNTNKASMPSEYPREDDIELFGKMSRNTVIANSGYNRESAEAELVKGTAKLISFARLFLANPDLPTRFERDANLNEADSETMYGGDEKGYIDYPTLDAQTQDN
jgi:N-ethylmaleimide reductase